jgi:ATP/maltotriose-dependent transcriptional regulator MalT
MLNVYRGDYARASAMQEESLSLAREARDVQYIAILTYNTGFAAAITGEYERAEALVRESQELFREVGDRGMALSPIAASGSWRFPGTIPTGLRNSAWRP